MERRDATGVAKRSHALNIYKKRVKGEREKSERDYRSLPFVLSLRKSLLLAGIPQQVIVKIIYHNQMVEVVLTTEFYLFEF